MLSNFLIKFFIKNSNDVQTPKVRNAYANLAGVIGILVNVLLFVIKLSVGLLVKSVAIMADAFNNLSDAASSVITIVGFRMANKPADAEHPFGHGRIEYISALIVSFMVMLVGIQFIKSSFDRIINPEPVTFELVPFILLLISIGFKIWLAIFNKNIGFKINSSALKASGTDALGDVFTSTTVVISFFAAKFTTFPLDGYIGIIVACAIVYSGYSLIKETLSPLLGEAPDPELVKEINELVLGYDNIIGVHDLVVHNYGPGRIMASIHAEIPSDIDIMKIHEIIDEAERQISKKLNIYLVVHMDPVSINCEEIKDSRQIVDEIISKYPIIKSIHDFRIIGENDTKTLIFDVVVSPSELNKEFSRESIPKLIEKAIKRVHPNYSCIITVDLELI